VDERSARSTVIGMTTAFEPAPLMELARQNHPGEPWIVEALSKCTHALSVSSVMVYFVASEKPNEPGSEWQFRTNVVLESPVDGTMVLDILKDGRVGAIEYVDRLIDQDEE